MQCTAYWGTPKSRLGVAPYQLAPALLYWHHIRTTFG